MIRKAFIVGILALGCMAADHTRPMVCRLVSSAQSVQQHFRALEASASALNPLQRAVLSLVLASTEAPRVQSQAPPAERRSW